MFGYGNIFHPEVRGVKENSVASHVVALSELHRIFANIWVVIGAFW